MGLHHRFATGVNGGDDSMNQGDHGKAHKFAVVIAMLFAVIVAACTKSPSPNAAASGLASPDSSASGRVGCDNIPSADDLKKWLLTAPDSGNAGGLFGGKQEWAAVVNRDGVVCAVAIATADPSAAWMGSEAISKAKAFTANAFSTDTLALSTARLYTLSLPGHSLWSVANGNPFRPDCFDKPTRTGTTDHRICGGTIAFGGGVALYKNGRKVGGLGLSGDTPCADHEIAKRIRNFLGYNPAKGAYADDITYSSVDHPSIYTHPLCPNTWRNGQKIGEEPVASGY